MAAHEELPVSSEDYHGYALHAFTLDGRACKVVAPRRPRADRAWVWKAEFFDAFPAFELAMLDRGYFLAFMDVGNTFGAPRALAHWDVFHRALTERHGFAARTILFGLSRGGLYIVNWAANHTEKIACLYGDNAVFDFKSWPGGKGAGPGSPGDWEKLIRDYGFADEREALAYSLNPIDNLAPLAKAKIPIALAVAEDDEVVPAAENSDVLERRYRAAGGPIRAFRHPGLHHPHGLTDLGPLIEYLETHAIRGQPCGLRNWSE